MNPEAQRIAIWEGHGWTREYAVAVAAAYHDAAADAAYAASRLDRECARLARRICELTTDNR